MSAGSARASGALAAGDQGSDRSHDVVSRYLKLKAASCNLKGPSLLFEFDMADRSHEHETYGPMMRVFGRKQST